MDTNAYHLQAQAQYVVNRALISGKLKRKPCEECGTFPSQAHHDSYYPEKWLDVRWLCAKHHREWHRNNEPEWPDIFDYHPSNDPLRYSGKSGRPPKPWYYKARRKWYVNLDGRRINLGPDKDEAFNRFFEIMRQREAGDFTGD